MIFLLTSPNFLLYGLLNLLGIYFLYKPIDQLLNDSKNIVQAKKRIDHLTWYSTIWIFFIGVLAASVLLIGVFVFQTASDVGSLDKMPAIFFVSVIPSTLFTMAILPSFITYFLINDFNLDLKEKTFLQFKIRYSIGKKKVGLTLFFAFIILVFFPILLIILDLATTSTVTSEEYDQFLSISYLQTLLNEQFVVLMGMIFAVVLIPRSLTKPIYSLLKAINKVSEGDYLTQAAIITEDEIGMLTKEFNEMVNGLHERDQMRQSLFLAREIQQNLLPARNPQIKGLEIAGSSIYCDETGGDYYDFIIQEPKDNAPMGIAIGDVSGHGIASALLMAAVRASLRQRSFLKGDVADIMSDVNRQLVNDVEDSGQFVTMFYLTIDLVKKDLEYVRAGHEPAIFYDPESDSFEELGGTGIALGVNENWNVKAYSKTSLKKGQIIFLCTDGILEARNPQGKMFGKKPIYDIIRNDSSSSANEIIKAMIEALNNFQKGVKIEDDVTLVIIKIED